MSHSRKMTVQSSSLRSSIWQVPGGPSVVAQSLLLRLASAAAGVAFGIEPHIRFKGQAGEQATMFFRDPAGNAMEFKAFADDSMIFAKE